MSNMIDELLRDVIYGCIQEAMDIERIRSRNHVLISDSQMAVKATKRIVAAIQLRETINVLRKKAEMPNSVSYSDEGTVVRAMTAIAGDGDLNMAQLMGVLNRLTEAGILFREAAEEKPRGPRKKNADGTETDEPLTEGTKLETSDAPTDVPSAG